MDNEVAAAGFMSVSRSIRHSSRLLSRTIIASTRSALVGDGIWLPCPGEVTLWTQKDGEEVEWDYPGSGWTDAQYKAYVRQEAESEAKQACKDDLEAQAARVNCAPGCEKRVGEPDIRVVRSSSGAGPRYVGTATAEGTLKVSCVRRAGRREQPRER